jgi:Putative bacterial sensory transduction regulator
MAWWPKRAGQADNGEPVIERTETRTRTELPTQRQPEQRQPEQRQPEQRGAEQRGAEQRQPEQAGAVIAQVDMKRLGAALERLEIRYLTDGDGSLLAMWERHAVLFTLEGPDDEILVIRARPHGTVPPDWADRAYRVVNEWNHSRRFCKAYIGDATERGQLPIYAEMQVPLISGAHDALLVELIDCAAAVAVAFVDWLHDEGGLL